MNLTVLLFVALAIVLPTASSAAIVTVPPDLNQGDQYRLVFVTSTTHNAETSFFDYNNFVTAAANTVPEFVALGTTWSAIISTRFADARDLTNTNPNLATGVPIYRLDGGRIADNNADLWDGTLDLPVRFTETGGLSTATFPAVWTGTLPDGTTAWPESVGSGSDGQTFTLSGDPLASTNNWVQFTSHVNLAQGHFYAISGILTVPVPEPGTLALGLLAAAGFGLLAPGARRAVRREAEKESHGALTPVWK